MKFRLTLWLGGAVLVAALPAWADSVHYSGVGDDSRSIEVFTKAANSGMKMLTRTRAGFRAKPVSADPNGAYIDPYLEFTEEPPNIEVSSRVIEKSSTEPHALPNAGFPSEDAPEATTEHFAKDEAFASGGSTRSLALDMLFFSSSSFGDTGMQSTSLNEFDFHESTSSIADAGKDWFSERDGDLVLHTREHRRYVKRVSTVSVPEAGSFSLLLLGLAGIGFLGFRRVNKIMASTDTAKYRTEREVPELAAPRLGPYRF
jgi:hypothetical protein